MHSDLQAQLQELLERRFSHEDCLTDQTQVQEAIEAEALLSCRIHGMLPPWKQYPHLPPNSNDWQHDAQKQYLNRFIAYYYTLNQRQRLRFRKYHREPHAWQGWLALLELKELRLPSALEHTMKCLYRAAPVSLPAQECKQLADLLRSFSDPVFQNLIVYGGGTIVRVFSDVEYAAVKESTKSCISFRRSDMPIAVVELENFLLCSADSLFLILPKDSLPRHEDPETTRALLWYIQERMLRDSLLLRPVLFFKGTSFVNIQQKKELSRPKKQRAQAGPSSLEIPCVQVAPETFSSSLREGETVYHRVWGQGRLIQKDLRAEDAFWQVLFGESKKTLSERWILSNCTRL